MDVIYCIVIDKSKLSNPDVWMKTYQSYILAIVKGHDGNERIIFAISFFKTIDVVADWLFLHSKCIDYDFTYRNIESAHRVLDQSLMIRIDTELVSGSVKRNVSFNNIENELKAKDTNFLGFNSYDYEKYVEVRISGGSISFDFLPRYDSQLYCVSFPFIRSLLKIPGMTSATNLDFVEVTDSSGIKFLAIKFKIGNEEYYYDYSQKPPVGPMFLPMPMSIDIKLAL